MYYVVKVDGMYRASICKDGKPSKYGERKLFSTMRDAQKWVDRNSYKGMSFRYEIREVK